MANDPSDAPPVQSDTPPDHTVIGLRIDVALLPEWFDAVKDIAAALARRMRVIEQPETWVVQIELLDTRLDVFDEHLMAAWDVFREQRRAEGRWP